MNLMRLLRRIAFTLLFMAISFGSMEFVWRSFWGPP